MKDLLLHIQKCLEENKRTRIFESNDINYLYFLQVPSFGDYHNITLSAYTKVFSNGILPGVDLPIFGLQTTHAVPPHSHSTDVLLYVVYGKLLNRIFIPTLGDQRVSHRFHPSGTDEVLFINGEQTQVCEAGGSAFIPVSTIHTIGIPTRTIWISASVNIDTRGQQVVYSVDEHGDPIMDIGHEVTEYDEQRLLELRILPFLKTHIETLPV